MVYVWKYFMDLNNKRLNTGYGYLPLQYSEIKAYFDLNSIDYSVLEVYLIDILDGITLRHYNEESLKNQQQQEAKLKSKK